MDRYGGDSTAEATLNLYWTARVLQGEASPADDVDDLCWFAPDELPPAHELAFENVPLASTAGSWLVTARPTRLNPADWKVATWCHTPSCRALTTV